MPVITVRLWAGRTRAQKAELARRMTDAMVEVAGCERDTVRVIFDDTKRATGPSADGWPTRRSSLQA